MPKLNPARSTASEENLARRIAYERQARNWKQAALARRMTELGCPMQGSTIFKIESGDPPRRVTVDELVAFSRAFGLDSSELLLPMSLVLNRSAMSVVKDVDKALKTLGDAVHAMVDIKIKLVQLRRKLPEDQAIADRVAEWLPRRMISYPLAVTHEDEDTAPDPVGDAWMELDEATTDYAVWITSQDWVHDGEH